MTLAEDPPKLTHRRRWTVRGMLGIVGLGVVLHLTIRDAFGWPTSTVFYGLPRPLLAILGVLAAGLARRLTRREFVLSACLAVILVAWVCYSDVHWMKPTVAKPEQQPLRIVVWNTAHLARGRVVVAEAVRKFEADLIGIVEGGRTSPADLEEWKRLLPGYEVASPQNEALILAKGPIIAHPKVSLGDDSTAMPATVTIGGQTFEIVLVDLLSNVFRSRSEPIRNLARLLDEAPRRPQIVMGDFNTPPESLAFRSLRQQYRDTFDAVGVGYRPTWPGPIALLKLDYIWVGPATKAVSCEHVWTTVSDHKPVIVSVIIDTTAMAARDSPPP